MAGVWMDHSSLPYHMCMVFLRYEIDDAFEGHHSMGMIYRTGHNKTVFRPYASECEY